VWLLLEGEVVAMPRPYPPEFRQRALDLARSGRPVAEVAELLGIAQSCLYRWKRQDLIGRGLKPGKGQAESAEFTAARQKIRDLEEENKILRKAAAARHHGRPQHGGAAHGPRRHLRLPLRRRAKRVPAQKTVTDLVKRTAWPLTPWGWRTRVELANAIFDYIEGFHNRRRRHSAIGWATPLEFETEHRHQATTPHEPFRKTGG
jgi:transposase-like protein